VFTGTRAQRRQAIGEVVAEVEASSDLELAPLPATSSDVEDGLIVRVCNVILLGLVREQIADDGDRATRRVSMDVVERKMRVRYFSRQEILYEEGWPRRAFGPLVLRLKDMCVLERAETDVTGACLLRVEPREFHLRIVFRPAQVLVTLVSEEHGARDMSAAKSDAWKFRGRAQRADDEGDKAGALRELGAAVNLLRPTGSSGHVAEVLLLLAEAWEKLGKPAQALAAREEALRYAHEDLAFNEREDDDFWGAMAHAQAMSVSKALGLLPAARSHAARALAGFSPFLRPDDPWLQELEEHLRASGTEGSPHR
jgi:tetratricopeptide (TPR) repeat protein